MNPQALVRKVEESSVDGDARRDFLRIATSGVAGAAPSRLRA
jgi:hypothetical protein